MQTKRIFLASSSELKEDRMEFEIFIYRKTKDWVDQGVFLELIVWQDFLDAVSKTRLQDEYNKAIRDCDIFGSVPKSASIPKKSSRPPSGSSRPPTSHSSLPISRMRRSALEAPTKAT